MKNFSVGIDARMLQHSGIGTYLRGLLTGLSSMNLPLRDYCLFGPEPCSTYKAFSKIKFESGIYSVSEQFRYGGHLRHCKLWHSPHYNSPIVKGKTRLVVTVHDLIHWIFRKDFFTPVQALYAGFMMNRVVQHADHIIAVSESTKQDLIQYFSASSKKISVIHEGVDSRFRALHEPEQSTSVCRKYALPEKFFLYVGNLKPHKNVAWLLEIHRQAQNQGRLHAPLVIVGKKDRSYRAGLQELAELKTGGGIHYLPSVESRDLPALYNSALALVHPSLYEGFGLTLLEAMSCGLPVIALSVASVPEITGQAAHLVPAGKSEDFISAMMKAERDSDFRKDLILRGHKRASEFSWNRMAQETLDVYQRVLHGA